MSRGVVGGVSSSRGDPAPVINPDLDRDRNGGCAWLTGQGVAHLARVEVQHLHARSSYRRTIPGCSFPLTQQLTK
jgi:hypothetical protein